MKMENSGVSLMFSYYCEEPWFWVIWYAKTLAEACAEVVATYGLLQSTSVWFLLKCLQFCNYCDCNSDGLCAGTLSKNTSWGLDGLNHGSKTISVTNSGEGPVTVVFNTYFGWFLWILKSTNHPLSSSVNSHVISLMGLWMGIYTLENVYQIIHVMSLTIVILFNIHYPIRLTTTPTYSEAIKPRC